MLGTYFLWLSACNIDIKVVHVTGKFNPVADLLSRLHITNHNFQKLHQIVHPVTLINTSDVCVSISGSVTGCTSDAASNLQTVKCFF